LCVAGVLPHGSDHRSAGRYRAGHGRGGSDGRR
jgi:hypothetical protein